jgi:hypothetical protein
VTVRVVAAVLAALALTAVSLPAVEHATDQRDAASVDAAVDDTADAVEALAQRGDPGDRIGTAPRRTVRLDVPADATLTVETRPSRLVAATANGAATTRRLPVPVRVCGGRESLRGDVTLAYVETRGSPVVVALRGFIGEDGSTPTHACTSGPRSGVARPGLPV